MLDNLPIFVQLASTLLKVQMRAGEQRVLREKASSCEPELIGWQRCRSPFTAALVLRRKVQNCRRRRRRRRRWKIGRQKGPVSASKERPIIGPKWAIGGFHTKREISLLINFQLTVQCTVYSFQPVPLGLSRCVDGDTPTWNSFYPR